MAEIFKEFGKFYHGDFDKFDGATGVAKIDILLEELKLGSKMSLADSSHNAGDSFKYAGGHGHTPSIPSGRA
jgi:hypothetical protein